MFFGLTNFLATFQTIMNMIFEEELRAGWLTIYMDDMLIHTKNDLPLHQKLVHQVLNKLKHHDLFLKPEKCLFKQQIMEFLGVVLENGTIRMDPTKVKGVADWPRPQSVRDVWAFLGFTGFYCYFVPNYSMIARPLIELMKCLYSIGTKPK
jgi:Reverse transcriptase (RNA-dependent DNA polymerase)